jgi:hypothetical protein
MDAHYACNPSALLCDGDSCEGLALFRRYRLGRPTIAPQMPVELFPAPKVMRFTAQHVYRLITLRRPAVGVIACLQPLANRKQI